MKYLFNKKIQTVVDRQSSSTTYFELHYGKRFLEKLFIGIILYLLFLIGVQIITNKLTLSLFLIDFCSVLIILTTIFIHIRMEEKKNTIKNEVIGFFVLNELTLILNTSKSLKEAVSFVVKSDYEIFSNLFKKAMINSHFGPSLTHSLKNQIETLTEGELKRIFLNILENWENSDELAKISNKMIINHISERIIEETGRLETWGSLFSGLFFLSPPIILCFLLLSGNLNISLGILLLVSVAFGSYFFKPDSFLFSILHESPLIPFTESNSLKFFVILAEHLISGLPYKNSFNSALNVHLKNIKKYNSDSIMESIVSFRLGLESYDSTNYDEFLDLFPSQTVKILILIEKFSQINTRLAGSKLLEISEELNLVNSLLTVGRAKIKAITFQRTFIKLLSMISLGFIAGANYLFQLVSNSFNIYTLKEYSYFNFDLLFILFGLIFSLLPLNFHLLKRPLNNINLVSKANMMIFFQLIIFLTTYLFTRILIEIPS
ncbi:MAG: hypothetical protein ACXABI_03720 [Candidatus Hodarchaeales archaeon]